MTVNRTTPKSSGIYIRLTDTLQVDEMLQNYPSYSREQINHYIKLYGPLRANVVYNLERVKNKNNGQ